MTKFTHHKMCPIVIHQVYDMSVNSVYMCVVGGCIAVTARHPSHLDTCLIVSLAHSLWRGPGTHAPTSSPHPATCTHVLIAYSVVS